jgi:hypothetical protein
VGESYRDEVNWMKQWIWNHYPYDTMSSD